MLGSNPAGLLLATSALAVRRSNPSARSHPQARAHAQLDLIHIFNSSIACPICNKIVFACRRQEAENIKTTGTDSYLRSQRPEHSSSHLYPAHPCSCARLPLLQAKGKKPESIEGFIDFSSTSDINVQILSKPRKKIIGS
jgi:hypothetical protein